MFLTISLSSLEVQKITHTSLVIYNDNFALKYFHEIPLFDMLILRMNFEIIFSFFPSYSFFLFFSNKTIKL